MQTNHLITVIFIISAFYINYVTAIHCYVCNSHENAECAQIPKNNTQNNTQIVNSFYKDCDQEMTERYNLYKEVMSLENHTGVNLCPFCDAYEEGKRYTLCRFTILSLRDRDGVESERFIRECAAIFDTSNASYQIRTKHTKIEGCVCGADGCNSRHRTIHHNFYSNLLLSLIVCLNFYLNY